MSITTWWHRHFTRLGRDIAWRERFAQRRGYAYPGHVPPRPMPAPAPGSGMWGPNVNPDPPPRPPGPISLAERSARFQRGMEVVHSLSSACMQLLLHDGLILAKAAADAKPHPPRPRQFGRIIAGETIFPGQVVHLEAHADGSLVARARQGDRHA
jgi:hypothetical protein